MVPHLRHTGLTVVVFATPGIYVYEFVKETKRKTPGSHCLLMQLHVISLELTFAGLQTFRPPVIKFFDAKSSAVLEPSTARSATTDSA